MNLEFLLSTGMAVLLGGAIGLERQIHEHAVSGLTTATTIWLSAAVETACGLDQYASSCTSVLMTVVVLVLLRPIEADFAKKGFCHANSLKRFMNVAKQSTVDESAIIVSQILHCRAIAFLLGCKR